MQHTIFQSFINNAIAVLQESTDMLGLAIAGSWITHETDSFSDLDLVLVSTTKISDNPEQMKAVANQLGTVLSAFTGEHVGETRLLICLYSNPLLHVDIKFLTLDEFHHRVENPVVVWERNHQLTNIILKTPAVWPYPDYQWIEDRFWVWIHYATLKIGRGELFEAFDFLGFIRMVVLGPLLHIKNGNQPRGVRKVETKLTLEDFAELRKTVVPMTKTDLVAALWKSIQLYEDVRKHLFDTNIMLKEDAAQEVKVYLQKVEKM
ncbi:nucleotidyltransferase domain-containing protein [Runella aurantiaca]|uniref:Nucleotidyltransferase domain-containing protein n=1 Tax=Runella aurantiaca TaxID=2282308 RepID=A0A369ICI7_9BACT|nr:nucleotidyltransferase domain-containing protein [Runella aurantiaca]RDB06147.1 nucleotidyltransferase domain-containing protein [Runella aurantiaca]